MDKILQKILENEVLNESTKKEITEAFAKSLEEAKKEQEKVVRAELAERYEQDKSSLHKAVELFLNQELQEHIHEFQKGISEANNLKLQYADSITKVKKESKDYITKKINVIETVLEKVLTDELKELHESEVKSRKAYLTAINEVKAKAENDRTKFKQRAASVLENIVNVQVRQMLDEYKSEIKQAYKDSFGREIFEAFNTTFRRQFFNSNAEFRKVFGLLEQEKAKSKNIMVEANNKIKEASERAKKAEISKNKLEETVKRTTKTNSLLRNLTGDARTKMKYILESVTNSNDLDKTYRKFLPDVMSTSKKKPTTKLDESVIELKTGGSKMALKEQTDVVDLDEDDNEISQIARLAGIRK